MADMKDDNGTSKTLSAAARRSFFRRRLKHKRSGSKDGKDLTAQDAISIDSLPITEGSDATISSCSHNLMSSRSLDQTVVAAVME